MNEAPSDVRLIEQMALGNAAALSVLYDHHHRLVFALAMRMLRRKEEAEDVLQDVFLRAWREAGTFEPERGSVEAWLCVMTRSRALDRLRRRRRHPEAAAEAADRTPSSEVALLDAETRHRVETAVAGLPASQRLALELAFYEDLTHVQVAQMLGQPLGTVKTRLRRALLKVRDALAVAAPSASVSHTSPFLVSLTAYFAQGNGGAATKPLHGISVLLVDNDAESRELVRAVLEGAGARVTEGRSVAEALRVLAEQWPHLLLADPAMRNEDGLALVREAAAVAEATGRRRPVAAAFTAARGAIGRRQALAAGFAAYVAKPVAPEELVTAMARLTAGSPGEGQRRE